MKKNKNKIIIIIIIVVLALVPFYFYNKTEVKSIRNNKQLYNIYNNNKSYKMSTFKSMFLLPFSILVNDYNIREMDSWDDVSYVSDVIDDAEVNTPSKGSSEKDYSKTNVQVEGVDEADIVKTDGDYVYSISGDKVVITDVKDPSNIKIVSKTGKNNSSIPEDLIIYKDKLVVIGAYRPTDYGPSNTVVTIYNISDKNDPKLEKRFELYEPYYTSRCIEGKLFVFSNGNLREKDGKIEIDYKEDGAKKEIAYKDIKYLKNNPNNVQTLIAEIDLNNINKGLKVKSYLINMNDAYVSEDSIYLDTSGYVNDAKISDIFGLKGALGIFKDYDFSLKTIIYKFKIDEGKGVVYSATTKLEGSTINQYSFDEKDGNLRVALKGERGTRVVVLDKKLHTLGESDSVAEGQIMYASRFMGDKAYLVTYRNTDPLFVVDLKDAKHPKVMGELHIPGYSVYLHPYDENHLIGIGMETKEKINRDSSGRIINTSAVVTGMKMSLFDVSDINNPKQLDKTLIGDDRTVSSVLTNPKALLFSKEKKLLAIPVNNYNEDFNYDDPEDYNNTISRYKENSNNYISEGYFVYNIDIENGFKLKGIVNHEKISNNDYYYGYNTKLLRGLYINNDLFTVSEDFIKVNKLDTLDEVASLKIKEEGEKINENGKQ